MNTTSSTCRGRMAREPKNAAETRQDAPTEDVVGDERAASPSPREPNKIEKVLSLLKRSKGATLDELVEATGWLRHTVRAALTGLKKKGYAVQRTKEDGASRYAVLETASR
ncbi:MAG: DUF3489 domain-containing protein [Sphingosinicella sp.]|uniref:DUF3489 domain-containing protein n=1 Tax=Sphingosinicella sp. TaxID=1917971 RepID=UPI0040379149